MSDIPDAAIEAAAEVLYNRQLMPDESPWYLTSDLDREDPREDARAAIEAAMPAIREAIAQEIEDSHRSGISRGSIIRLGALADAARLVRGGTP